MGASDVPRGVREADVTASVKNEDWTSEDSFEIPLKQQSEVLMEQPYCEHTEVEYYSSSNHSWVYGKISEMTPLRRGVPESAVTCDVVVGKTQQMRRFVPLSVLRTPLRKKEPCEIISNISSGLVEWSPAIVDDDPKAPTIAGYTVRLLMGDVVRVAANRVRRRFPAGSEVEFFAGGEVGWTKALVVEPGDTKVLVHEGAGVEDLRSTNEKCSQGGADLTLNFEQTNQPLVMVSGETQISMNMWSEVEISLHASSGDSRAMRVSGHLLRLCHEAVTCNASKKPLQPFDEPCYDYDLDS